jgi:signal recognition particle subunit SEC65
LKKTKEKSRKHHETRRNPRNRHVIDPQLEEIQEILAENGEKGAERGRRVALLGFEFEEGK